MIARQIEISLQRLLLKSLRQLPEQLSELFIGVSNHDPRPLLGVFLASNPCRASRAVSKSGWAKGPRNKIKGIGKDDAHGRA